VTILDARIRRLGSSQADRIYGLGLPPRNSEEYLRALGIEAPPPIPPFDNRASRRAFAAKLKAWLRKEAAALDAYEADLGTRDMTGAHGGLR
jgi:hypothetical protein